MANEGSTKPTYSELESCEHDYSLATCKCLKCGHEYDPAYAGTELLRVRGLLQHAKEALLSCQESANTNPLTNGICVACGAAYDHYTNCVLLVPEGAESADIGKLDSADEKLRELVKALKEACETVLSDPTDKSLSPQYWLNRIEGLRGSA